MKERLCTLETPLSLDPCIYLYISKEQKDPIQESALDETKENTLVINAHEKENTDTEREEYLLTSTKGRKLVSFVWITTPSMRTTSIPSTVCSRVTYKNCLKQKVQKKKKNYS